MTKYTAADFANARFAEHESGQAVAIRWTQDYAREPDGFWTYERPLNNKFSKEATHQEMADMHGWVPVPPNPTITESEFEDIKTGWGKIASQAWLRGFTRAGGEVVPDPEPTNKEKWVTFLRKVNPDSIMIDDYAEAIVAAGVTPPEDSA